MEISPHRLNASYTTDGEFRVHRSGCRDIKRQSNNWAADYPEDMRTPEAIALDLWDDIIDEGGMAPEDAVDNVTFLPCCEFKQVSNNSEEVVDADANPAYTEVVGQEGPAGTQGVTMDKATANRTLVEYTAELQAAKTTDLRKVARQAGLKVVGTDTPVNKGRKADLIFALVELKGQELDAQVKADAKPAKKAKKVAKTSDQKSDDNALKIRTARKFVAEAEAKGWNVKIDNQMATDAGDVVIVSAEKGEESITLRWIDGAYDYYQGGSFHTDAKGKSRKILNVSAAISRYL